MCIVKSSDEIFTLGIRLDTAMPCHVLYILDYLFRWFGGNIECVLFAHVLMIFNECQCACSFVCSAFHTICANESVDGVRNMIVQLRAFNIRCDGNDIPIPYTTQPFFNDVVIIVAKMRKLGEEERGKSNKKDQNRSINGEMDLKGIEQKFIEKRTPTTEER